MRYSADETVYSQAVPAVLSMMKTGILTGPRKRYGLSEVAFAHSELEAGRITGSAVLIP
jgi:NADPH2:quinone reductase